VDIRVAALPPGADPADLARSDPAALQAAVTGARPFLAFRLDRLFARSDLATAEGRVRAATEAVGVVGAHPNELLRDQYLMEVADRCRMDVTRLRSLPPPVVRPSDGRGRPGSRSDGSRSDGGRSDEQDPAGGAPLLGLSSVEEEALRLAINRPGEVADRLEDALFSHPLALAAFQALCGADTLLEAIEEADPQAAQLLSRLAVEEDDGDTEAVMVRLVERAGSRAVNELKAELRAAEDPGAYAVTLAWLKLALESLRVAEADGEVGSVRNAEDRLVAWLVDRTPATGSVDADHGFE
jgi:DNA primase